MGKKLQKKRKTTNCRKRTSSNHSHSEVVEFDILHDVPSQLSNSMEDENSCDRISDLPEDILRQIISSLPFELVAQTRLLSTRWRDVRHITLCQWTFQVMFRPSFYSYYSYPVFHFLKELWWICSSINDDNINSLISFLVVSRSPRLEKLYVTIDPSCYSLQNPSKGDFDWTSNYFELLQRLTVVKMDGLTSEEDELKLADRIFQITTKKPTVLATSRNSSYTRRLVKINQNQRKFVEEMDTQLLNTKHMHMSS